MVATLASPAPNTSKQACISAYKDAGFHLFPCEGPLAATEKEWKKPVNYGWQDENMPSNLLPDVYGVPLSEEVMILDYDPKREDKPGNSLSLLWQELSLPYADTFIVRTGSGGVHVYLTKPPGVYVRGRVPGYDAIDIKTGGGYVIGAGSAHFSGSSYTVERGIPSRLMEAPVALLDKVQLLRGTSGQVGTTSADTDTVRRFTQFCKTCIPAIEGNGGERQTLLVAMMGKDFGLPEEYTADIMLEHYNVHPQCQPVWEEAEILKKVQNAYQYGQNEIGYLNASAAFESVAIDVPSSSTSDRTTLAHDDSELQEELAQTYNGTINFTWTIDKTTSHKKFDSTLNNVLGFMRLMPRKDNPNPMYKLFRYNMMADSIEFTRKAFWHDDYTSMFLTDTDLVLMKEYFANKNLHVSTDVIREACVVQAHEYRYHPVRQWLRSIKHDGVPRLDTMLTVYFGAANVPIIHEFSKNSMIAAVARAEIPGCQHDHMIVLEGDQEIGKTSAIRVLGGEFAGSPKLNPGTKDTLVKTMGLWFIEMAELEVLRRTDVAELKAWMTLTHDIDRLPFDRLKSRIARQFVLWGTINPDKAGEGYLQDNTGNRRFWPVMTTKIDLEGLKRDRDQLFAEAYARFKNPELKRPEAPHIPGEPWWITDPELKKVARGEQSARQQEDVWYDAIQEHLAKVIVPPNNLTTQHIALHALGLAPGRLNVVEKRRISNVMVDLGYKRSWGKEKDKTIRTWVIEIPVDNCAWL